MTSKKKKEREGWRESKTGKKGAGDLGIPEGKVELSLKCKLIRRARSSECVSLHKGYMSVNVLYRVFALYVVSDLNRSLQKCVCD